MGEHQHQATGDGVCMVTKDEAAAVAGVTVRTIDNWAAAGHLEKFTKGPAGYWVRFCRVEVRERAEIRPVPSGGPGS